jgi:hypothetical protein
MKKIQPELSVPKIYAETYEGKVFDDGEVKSRMHYFYLDGLAEDLNNYDICQGNIYAHSAAQSNRLFEAIYVSAEGEEKGCFVHSYYDNHLERMRGLIWLMEDEGSQEHIEKARNEVIPVIKGYHIDKEGYIHFEHDKFDKFKNVENE